MNRKLRMGMVGGSGGAFIGSIHRKAALMDGEIELVCGAFSASPEKSLKTGKQLYLPKHRIYGSFHEMISCETALPENVRMDFVSIVTPNYLHFPQAKEALENGFHVICDKPMTMNLREAVALGKLVRQTGLVFALTHNYTGYPMVRQAREMVKRGELGILRKVVVEYPQGWLATLLEITGHKQASWRADPARTGAVLTMGDIGTHAENLQEFVTGLKIKEISADLGTLVPGRNLDDDVSILVHYDNGAHGVITASQISTGEENNLRIKVYGEKGGLEWSQMEPNSLKYMRNDQPLQILRAGTNMPGLYEPALRSCRLPGGHPEGFIEAFANIYLGFAAAVRAHLAGKPEKTEKYDFPTVQDGIRGMAFIEKVLESSRNRGKWTSV